MPFETSEENDLFYTCSLIEYIARKTNNKKKYIVENLGEKNIKKILELAEIYHVENIDKVASEYIEKCKIKNGDYDILNNCKYDIPSYFDIGKVYERLIIMVDSSKKDYIHSLIQVLSSWIVEKIDNYNSSMYYENPEYIYECYKQGKVI